MAEDVTVPPDAISQQAQAAAMQQQAQPQTLQQKADSSAAWLAANRPDLVSQPAGSAEAAAAINRAYLTNQLPILPKYAPKPEGEPGTEQDLTRVYIGGSADVQGTPMDLTRSQYIAMFGRTPEQSEAQKYQAYNAPINYGAMANLTLSQIASRYGDITAGRVQDYYQAHPSARFLAITQQYEERQYYSVGSGGMQYQPTAVGAKNPFPEDSAAGIMWYAQRQGGNITEATAGTAVRSVEKGGVFEGYSYLLNVPAGVSSQNLTGGKTVADVAVVSGMETVPIRDLSYEATKFGGGGNVGSVYERMAWAAVQERPGYTQPQQLGDLTTQRVIAGYTAFSEVMGMTGVQLASPTTMTGQVLETQRQMAYMTPSRRDETFFMGELQKWGENYVEVASAYHHYSKEVGDKIGTPAPANPFEYQADLAVEFLKGAPTRDVERFSPVSGEMSQHLPGGEGVQQFAWREAVSTYRRSEGMEYTTPKQVSFMEGVKYLGAAEGLYGPYGKLYGGVDTGGVESRVLSFGSDGRTVGSGMVAGTAQTPSVGEQPVVVSTVMRPSDFDLWAANLNIPVLSGAMVATSDFLFSGTGPAAMMAKSGADVFKAVGVGSGGEATFSRYMITTEVGPSVKGPATVTSSTPVSEHFVDRNGVETIITTSSTTITGSESSRTTIKYTPVIGGFEYGAARAGEALKSITPEMPKDFGKGTPWEYNVELARGAYEGLREHPLEAATWAGIGGVMVAGGAAVASLGEATIAATAGTSLAPVAVGTHWFASTAAPVALTVLYGADVMQRSTQAHLYYKTTGAPAGLKLEADLSPKATYRFGEIFATETGPMIAGGALVAYGPSGIARGIGRAKAAWEGWEPRSPGEVYRDISSGISQKVYEYRQSRAGVENIGVEGGKGFTVYDDGAGYTMGGRTVGGAPAVEVKLIGEGTQVSPAAKPIGTPESIVLSESDFAKFIYDYSGQGYLEVGRKLDTGQPLGFDITKTFEQHQTSNAPDIIYRGISGEYAENIGGMKPGDIFESKRLMSFSESRTQAHMFTDTGWKGVDTPGVILKMKTTGEILVDVAGRSVRNEQELIGLPGQFRIVSVGKEYLGSEWGGGAGTELLGKSTFVEIERVPVTHSTGISGVSDVEVKLIGEARSVPSSFVNTPASLTGIAIEYPSLDAMFGTGPKLLETTKQIAIRDKPWEFREARESMFRINTETGEITLAQKEAGIPTFGGQRTGTSAKIVYDIDKLNEPLAGQPPAWTESTRQTVKAKTITTATLDPFTGELTVYTQKTFELHPKAKEPVPGFQGEQGAYQMNIYDLPMYVERGGFKEPAAPDVNAIAKAVFGEQRAAGVVDVVAKRTVGTYGEVSRGFREGGKGGRTVLEETKTREINKAFEELTSAEIPVNIDIGRLAKGEARPAVIKAAEARKAADTRFRNIAGQPVKVIDLAKVGKGAGKEPGVSGTGQVLAEPKISVQEKAGDVFRNVMKDITPLHEPKVTRMVDVGGKTVKYRAKKATPESAASAMEAAQKAHAITVKKNLAAQTSAGDKLAKVMQDVNPVRTVRVGDKTVRYIGQPQTEFIRKVAMGEAGRAHAKTVERNVGFVGKQIEDIVSGKTKPREKVGPVVDTTESRIFSEAMLDIYKKEGRAREERLAMMRFGGVLPSERLGAVTGVSSATGEERTERQVIMPVPDIGSREFERILIGLDRPVDFGRDISNDILRDLIGGTSDRGRIRDLTDTRRYQDIIPAKDVVQTSRQITDEIVKQFEEVVPFEDTQWKKKITPEEPRIPPMGIGFGGGAGGGPTWTWRTNKYEYRNPVVDLPYLTSLSGRFGFIGMKNRNGRR